MSRDWQGNWYYGPYRPGHRGYKQKFKTHAKALAERSVVDVDHIQNLWVITKPLREDGKVINTRRLPATYHDQVYNSLDTLRLRLEALVEKLDK